MKVRVHALAVGAVLVAGCAGGGDAPSATSSSSPAASPTPITTPTAGVPAEASAPTLAGAEAFARLFYARVEQGFDTQDPSLVGDISLPSCTACGLYVRSTTQVRDGDLRVDGGEFTLLSVSTGNIRADGTATVVITWNSARARILDAAGTQVQEEPALSRVTERMTLQRRGDSWVVADLRKTSG